MARRAVREQNEPINPVFFIPDGVDDLAYTNDAPITVTPDDIDENEFEVDIDIDNSDPSESDDPGDSLETPQVLDVFSQTIRMASAGNEVVDVVFDITEVMGVSNYEIRVVKT